MTSKKQMKQTEDLFSPFLRLFLLSFSCTASDLFLPCLLFYFNCICNTIKDKEV